MADSKKSYERQLRTIGQSLEAQRIRIFKLHQQGERFVVNGAPDQETTLLAKLLSWQKRNRSTGMNESLSYTVEDLNDLDRQGQARRTKANRLPDFHTLPNTLRTVGSHLEIRGAQLIELQKKDLSVTIVARNSSGHPEFEERSLASLYEIFTRQHGKRKPLK